MVPRRDRDQCLGDVKQRFPCSALLVVAGSSSIIEELAKEAGCLVDLSYASVLCKVCGDHRSGEGARNGVANVQHHVDVAATGRGGTAASEHHSVAFRVGRFVDRARPTSTSRPSLTRQCSL